MVFHSFFSHYLDQTSYHFCIFIPIASFFFFLPLFPFHLTRLHGKSHNSSFLLAADVKILSAAGGFPLWRWLQVFRTNSEMIGLCSLGSDLYESCKKPFQGLSPFIWKLLVEPWPLPELQLPLLCHLLAGPGTCTRALTRDPGRWPPQLALSLAPYDCSEAVGLCPWTEDFICYPLPPVPLLLSSRQPPPTQSFPE